MVEFICDLDVGSMRGGREENGFQGSELNNLEREGWGRNKCFSHN